MKIKEIKQYQVDERFSTQEQKQKNTYCNWKIKKYW